MSWLRMERRENDYLTTYSYHNEKLVFLSCYDCSITLRLVLVRKLYWVNYL